MKGFKYVVARCLISLFIIPIFLLPSKVFEITVEHYGTVF